MNNIFQKVNLSLYVPLDYLEKRNKIPNKKELIRIFSILNIGIISDIYYTYELDNSPKGMYIYFDYLYEEYHNINWFIPRIYNQKYVKIVFDDPTYMKCYLNRYHDYIQTKIVNSSIYNDYSLMNISEIFYNKISRLNNTNYYAKPLLTRSYHITNQYIYYYNELINMYNMLINYYEILDIKNDKKFQYKLDCNLYVILHKLGNPINSINLYNDKKQLQKNIYEVIMDYESKLGCSLTSS